MIKVDPNSKQKENVAAPIELNITNTSKAELHTYLHGSLTNH